MFSGSRCCSLWTHLILSTEYFLLNLKTQITKRERETERERKCSIRWWPYSSVCFLLLFQSLSSLFCWSRIVFLSFFFCVMPGSMRWHTCSNMANPFDCVLRARCGIGDGRHTPHNVRYGQKVFDIDFVFIWFWAAAVERSSIHMGGVRCCCCCSWIFCARVSGPSISIDSNLLHSLKFIFTFPFNSFVYFFVCRTRNECHLTNEAKRHESSDEHRSPTSIWIVKQKVEWRCGWLNEAKCNCSWCR